MTAHRRLTRRQFVGVSATLLAGTAARLSAADADSLPKPVIDIHQHTHYHGRSDEQLIAHQQAMGVTTTILLPAGTIRDQPSTHHGKSNGLAAQCGGNETVLALTRQHPNEFRFGANEVTDLPGARAEIEKYLKLGAIIIAEQKFGVECDSKESQTLYQLAADYQVPILMHFQEGTYNSGFARLHTMLKKFPRTTFLGHAQTWWANIDKNHTDQKILYPKGKVTPGGLTDRYLSDYPNVFADMSAGSGLNALTRDEEHARGFLERHQDKILYGSDCADTIGRGIGCQGAQTIAALRRLSTNQTIERKILFENAKKMFKL